MSGLLSEIAPAKINLTLSVGKKRADGLHELSSLVLFAELADKLTISSDKETALEISGVFASAVPVGADNLALKALRFSGCQGRVRLEKNIPVAAGLGGGSADAAAVLRALDPKSEKLDEMMRLGADVPVCFLSRPVFMSGAGERLAPLSELAPLWCVLVKPDVELRTADIFAAWDKAGSTTRHQMPRDFRDAQDLFSFCALHKNDLQPFISQIVPQADEVLALLDKTTPGARGMSGSGPACFALYAEAEQARKAEHYIRAHSDHWVWAGKIRAGA